MDNELLIPQIFSNTRDWTARVLVVEKGQSYEAGKGHLRQKLILMDEHGNTVRGLIWNDHIKALEQTIKPFKTYYLRGPYVQPIREAYLSQSDGCKMQWTINRTNYISLVEVIEKQIQYLAIEVTPFAKIPPKIDTKETIGLSLGTNTSSFVAIEPDIHEARELHNWANNNLQAIQTTTNIWLNEDPYATVRYNPQKQLVPVAQINPQSKSTWIKVTMKFKHLKQECYFRGCPECGGRTYAFLGANLLLNYKTIQEQEAMVIGAEAEIENREFIAEVGKPNLNYGDEIARYIVQICFPANTLDQIPSSNTEPKSAATSLTNTLLSEKTTKKVHHFDTGSSSATCSQRGPDEKMGTVEADVTSSDKDSLPSFKKLKLKNSDSNTLIE